MFSRILIANRGEIACRVIKTAKRLGIRTVAVYSDADAKALHVEMADEAVHIGPAPARESYLKGDAIIAAAQATGAEAIHPGYGFLSENAEFAEAVEAAGLVFIGPPASAIRAMGLKDGAKRLMEEAGVPVVPGYHGDNQDPAFLASEAARIGFPVLIKAVAGGGGKGMRRVDAADAFTKALEGAQREAKASFGDDRVLIEKFVTHPRHVEIQVFADSHGNAVHLFERDCSLQRRHQKVVEEAPAPGMTEEVRNAMGQAAVEAARTIGYRGAGTVEFIADGSNGLRKDGFFFMEMNTRLQVEHPVTEEITDTDLVEWQLRVAAGERLPLLQEDLSIYGHAVEVRLYAENPAKNFLPATGTLHRLDLETDVFARIDTGVSQGDTVTVHYDPMIAKVIAEADTREQAIEDLARALEGVEIAGVTTNAGFLKRILRHPDFIAGNVDTGFIDRHLTDLVPADTGPDREVKAIAALALLTLPDYAGNGADFYSPWNNQDGWRIGERARATLRFGGHEPFEVGVQYRDEGWLLTINGENIEAQPDPWNKGYLANISVGGRKLNADAELRDGILYVMRDGETWDIPLHDPLDAAGADADGGATLTAPMPGKIVSVHAKPGDTVSRGQALVVLEAMKMEHTLSAGRDATIESMTVAPGDQVEEGAVVVTLVSD